MLAERLLFSSLSVCYWLAGAPQGGPQAFVYQRTDRGIVRDSGMFFKFIEHSEHFQSVFTSTLCCFHCLLGDLNDGKLQDVVLNI